MEQQNKLETKTKINEPEEKSQEFKKKVNQTKQSKEKKILYHSLTILKEEEHKIVDNLKNYFPNWVFGIKENDIVSWENNTVNDEITEITKKLESINLEEKKEKEENQVINLSVNDETEINKKIKNGSILVKTEEEHIYLLNKKFHITLLFTGGKPNEHDEEFITLENNTINVSVNRIGFSENFIVLGVNIPSDIPYYGNETKHITVGLRQKVGKFKVFPKDSPTAFSEETDIPVDFTLKGNIEKVLQ